MKKIFIQTAFLLLISSSVLASNTTYVVQAGKSLSIQKNFPYHSLNGSCRATGILSKNGNQLAQYSVKSVEGKNTDKNYTITIQASTPNKSKLIVNYKAKLKSNSISKSGAIQIQFENLTNHSLIIQC